LKRVTKFGDKKKDVSNKEHPQPVASFVAENQTTCLKDKKIVGFEIKGKQFLRFEQIDYSANLLSFLHIGSICNNLSANRLEPCASGGGPLLLSDPRQG
jgi:hypothetical protein